MKGCGAPVLGVDQRGNVRGAALVAVAVILEASSANVTCAGCLTWATAKQIIIVTGGPPTLNGSSHIRMQALEDRLQALEADLRFLSLDALLGELDAAFGELLAIAQQEVVRIDVVPPDAEVVAVRSA